LGLRRHDVRRADAVDEALQRLYVFRRIDRESGLVGVQQAAAVLLDELVELVELDRLEDAERVFVQRANLGRRVVEFLPCPILSSEGRRRLG